MWSFVVSYGAPKSTHPPPPCAGIIFEYPCLVLWFYDVLGRTTRKRSSIRAGIIFSTRVGVWL